MAKKANTTMIGGFVVIAFFLLAASVVILGSGKLFKRTESFVLYFDSSIKGLSAGAPVLIQGVQIGSVTSISIHADHKNLSMNIPVYIEIEPDKFHVKNNGQSKRSPSETIAVLAERGLRAVLSMQSIITGQLMIELDYYPNTPLKFQNLDPDYPEIPTIPSTTERLYQVFQDIDFVDLANHVKNAMVGVDDLVNNADITEGLKSFRQTADELRLVVNKIDHNIDGLISEFDNVISDTSNLVNNANDQVQPLVNDLRKLIGNFDELLENINQQVDVLAGNLNESVIGFRGVVSEDAPLVQQLEETLGNITSMTDSIRQLADYLEQHPESLIRGKKSY